MSDKNLVTFYLLSKPVRNGRLHLACRLAETAYKRGHRVYIHAPDAQTASQIDSLLWTFNERSFVPHALTDVAQDRPSDFAVTIGASPPDESHNDVLIPLLDGVPEYFKRFARVMESVDFEDSEKKAARARFRAYRDLDVEPTTHDI